MFAVVEFYREILNHTVVYCDEDKEYRSNFIGDGGGRMVIVLKTRHKVKGSNPTGTTLCPSARRKLPIVLVKTKKKTKKNSESFLT